MRKIVVAVVLAATCLAAGLALWHRSEEREQEAAQLAPAETLLLADFPDLPATAMRWKQTTLYEIFKEPQVQAFLAKPLEKLQHNNAWAEAQQNIHRIEPKSAFLAVEKIVNNMPYAVAGVAFGGDRRELEKLLEQARAHARKASPNGKFDRLQYREFEIESFADNGVTVAGCFARKWYFVSNDIDLLKSTLDRLSGKTVATLAKNPTYSSSRAHLPIHPDFRLFSQPGALSNKLLTQLNAVEAIINLQDSAAIRKIQGVAVATRIEGKNIRDTLFLYEPEPTQRPVLNGKTLHLTTPDTLFYAAMAPTILEKTPQRGKKPSGPGTIPITTLLTALNSPPATLAEFQSAFGPEHALLLDWPAAVAQPSLILVCEIRNPAEARRFVETVFHAWNRADSDGIPLWTLTADNPEMSQFHPAVALTGEHFLAGLSIDSLKPFASNAANPSVKSDTLVQSKDFQSAMALLAKPETGMAYLNSKQLFERVYGFLRPAAMLWGNQIPELGDAVDFGKLPQPACIADHLTPICLSVSQKESGILVESTGPVSFLELSAGAGAAVFAIASPTIQYTPPDKGLFRGLPPSPPKPLSLPLPASAASGTNE